MEYITLSMVELLVSILTTSLVKYNPYITWNDLFSNTKTNCNVILINVLVVMYLHIHQIELNNSILILIQLLFHLNSIRGSLIKLINQFKYLLNNL